MKKSTFATSVMFCNGKIYLYKYKLRHRLFEKVGIVLAV